jgi:hypothetical protein
MLLQISDCTLKSTNVIFEMTERYVTAKTEKTTNLSCDVIVINPEAIWYATADRTLAALLFDHLVVLLCRAAWLTCRTRKRVALVIAPWTELTQWLHMTTTRTSLQTLRKELTILISSARHERDYRLSLHEFDGWHDDELIGWSAIFTVAGFEPRMRPDVTRLTESILKELTPDAMHPLDVARVMDRMAFTADFDLPVQSAVIIAATQHVHLGGTAKHQAPEPRTVSLHIAVQRAVRLAGVHPVLPQTPPLMRGVRIHDDAAASAIGKSRTPRPGRDAETRESAPIASRLHKHVALGRIRRHRPLLPVEEMHLERHLAMRRVDPTGMTDWKRGHPAVFVARDAGNRMPFSRRATPATNLDCHRRVV